MRRVKFRVKFRLKERLRWVPFEGDAFGLLGAFRRAARGEGWTDEEVDGVILPAIAAKDFDALVRALAAHTDDPWSSASEFAGRPRRPAHSSSRTKARSSAGRRVRLRQGPYGNG